MPFATGTANSVTDLLSAFQAACTANGYTLTGNVLSKGTLFAQVAVSGAQLAVNAGTGQSAGVLSGASDVGAALLGITTSGVRLGVNAFTFPLNYFVHINTAPDEVYLIVNVNAVQYQFLAFGQSTTLGLVGSGNWFAATQCATTPNVDTVDITVNGGDMWAPRLNGGLFQGSPTRAISQNGAVDHKLDAATWSVEGAWRDAWTLLPNSPSNWNGESILIPVTVYATRPSGFVSTVAELAHARFVAIDNLNDQQIITLGADRWKIYPWWKRGVRGMPPTNTASDTATLGHAIRYDGP